MSNNDKPFSERTGLVSPKAMQTDDLDQATRTALYNAVLPCFRKRIVKPTDKRSIHLFTLTWNIIGTKFFKLKIDSIFSRLEPHTLSEEMKSRYENVFFSTTWYQPFDFIEHLYLFVFAYPKSFANAKVFANNFSKAINNALKQENVGYKFFDGKFIPITNEEEVQAIEQALASPYENAREHIKNSITRFADRPNPDYANSIKESISAVESLAKEITGENNFDKAIEKLKEKGVKLHPQFEKAIKNMYQFTSDTSRHGHSTEKNLQRPEQNDQATARYMLIVCSAIVSFIADKTADKKP